MTVPVLHILLVTIAAVSGLKLETDRMTTHTTVSQNKSATLTFVAGLEGSGHHLLWSFMDYLHAPHDNLLPHQWFKGDNSTKEPDYSNNVKLWANLPQGKNAILGLGPPMASYPTLMGPHEARMHFHYPRLDWIREAAHEANVNFQVILLHRPLDDCLAADCLHRQFETCPQTVETMKANADHLAVHLSAIPSSDVQCFIFGDPDIMLNSLQDAFGSEEVPKDIVDQVYVEHPSQHLRDNVPNWDDLVTSLKGAQTSLDTICAHSQKMGMKSLFDSFRSAA